MHHFGLAVSVVCGCTGVSRALVCRFGCISYLCLFFVATRLSPLSKRDAEVCLRTKNAGIVVPSRTPNDTFGSISSASNRSRFLDVLWSCPEWSLGLVAAVKILLHVWCCLTFTPGYHGSLGEAGRLRLWGGELRPRRREDEGAPYLSSPCSCWSCWCTRSSCSSCSCSPCCCALDLGVIFSSACVFCSCSCHNFALLVMVLGLVLTLVLVLVLVLVAISALFLFHNFSCSYLFIFIVLSTSTLHHIVCSYEHFHASLLLIPLNALNAAGGWKQRNLVRQQIVPR